jgi:triacylglycerol lipase
VTLWNAVRRQLSPKGLLRIPPIWREGRAFDELATFRRDPIASGVGLPDGDGLPVFLIPGYMAGDGSLGPMAGALSAANYRTETSGVLFNVGCANEMYGPMEARLASHVATNGGRKAFLVGQSRGGGLGRWLAARRPDLVAGLVTLGTPLRDPLALHPAVLMNLGMVSALGSLGIPGLLSTNCLHLDRCCGPVWRELTKPLPAELPFLSIYSRSDGIVDWRACLDPTSRHLEVDSSHCGMAFNVEVIRAIGDELGRVVQDLSR